MGSSQTYYFRCIAPAKVNLGLRLLGRDGAGFHLLESTFQCIALHDVLHIRFSPHGPDRIALSCSDPSIPCRESNIVWRCVEYLRRDYGLTGTWRVHIDKNIPVGSGLGGSSADAAGLLRDIRHLIPGAQGSLEWIANSLQLGADVPFLLQGGRAHGLGRGEILSPLPMHGEVGRPLWLIIPSFSCLTPQVFAAVHDHERAPRSAWGRAVWQQMWQRRPQECLHNDLWPAACRVQPALREIGQWLTQQGLRWGLSGSGSTLISLDPPQLPPPAQVRVVATHFLDRSATLVHE